MSKLALHAVARLAGPNMMYVHKNVCFHLTLLDKLQEQAKIKISLRCTAISLARQQLASYGLLLAACFMLHDAVATSNLPNVFCGKNDNIF